MPRGTQASGPVVAVRAIPAINVWNWVARSTDTGSLLRSSTISEAYFAR